MKKILALILALCMVFALCACGNEKTPDPTKSPDTTDTPATTEPTAAPAETEEPDVAVVIETVTPGVLTVATSPDFAPYEFYALDEEGTPTLAGFDMDLAKYIADYLGLELEVIPMDFDGTIMELAAGKVDLGMAGYSPDPERADKMDFSDIYITGGQSFVCLQSNKDQFTSLEDTNKAEYSIGAQAGSIQAGPGSRTNSPDAEHDRAAPRSRTSSPSCWPASWTAPTSRPWWPRPTPRTTPTAERACWTSPMTQEGSVVGVSKGNAALLEGVNRAIAAALEDGTMDEFITQANELASGETYEGLLDENGQVAETPAEG